MNIQKVNGKIETLHRTMRGILVYKEEWWDSPYTSCETGMGEAYSQVYSIYIDEYYKNLTEYRGEIKNIIPFNNLKKNRTEVVGSRFIIKRDDRNNGLFICNPRQKMYSLPFLYFCAGDIWEDYLAIIDARQNYQQSSSFVSLYRIGEKSLEKIWKMKAPFPVKDCSLSHDLLTVSFASINQIVTFDI